MIQETVKKLALDFEQNYEVPENVELILCGLEDDAAHPPQVATNDSVKPCSTRILQVEVSRQCQ